MIPLDKTVFVFLLSLFAFQFSFSQEPSIKNYDISKGLPSNECYRVIQDQKGYIWVASDAGLSRYNGYSFQNFTKKEGLPDNVIINLFEDYKGRIWVVGLNAKIAYFDKETFYPTEELNAFLEKNVNKAQIHSAFVNDKEELCLGFGNNYAWLITYSLLKKKITPLRKIDPFNILIKPNKGKGFIYGVNSNPENSKKYFNNLLYNVRIDQENEKKQMEIKFTARPVFVQYLSIGEESTLISVNNDLFLIKGQMKVKIKSFKKDILFLYKDNKGRIWVLSQNDGVHIFDAVNILNNNPKHLFEGYSFSSITEDRENSYWLSSLKEGLYQIPNFDITHYSIKQDNKAIKINAVTKWNNAICAAGQSNSVYAYKENNIITKLFDLPYEGNEVFDMLTQKNTLIIAGHISFLANEKSNQIYLQKIENIADLKWSTLYLKHIDVCKTNRDTILVGGSNNYVKINIHTAKKVSSGVLLPNIVNNLFTDTISKKIYLACVDGLYCLPDRYLPYTTITNNLFNSIKNHFSILPKNLSQKACIFMKDNEFYYTPDNYLSYSKITDKLLDTRINHITKKDSLFILSSKERGLIFWDEKKSWNIDKDKGLASNACKKALLDDQGNIWVATNKGVSKIEKTTGGKFEISTLTTHEGLTSNDIYNFSIIDNNVWIPTTSGLSRFNTSMWIKNNSPPPIYITSILVDDSLYKSGLFTEIPYQHNYVKINYNGLSYKNNEGLTYEYRLSGLDTGWKKTNNTQIEFTRLASGEYSFEVRAIKNGNIKSPSTAVFSFVIYPPWYKTWWFILFLFISVVSIIYLFFWIRFKRLKAREEEKTKLITLVTETEIKALRAQTNPHFIFNALNSIRLFVLKNDSDQAQFYLMRFAELMRDVLENSEYDVIDLNKEFSILKTYMELEVLRFGGKYKFKIIIPEDLLDTKIHIPPLLLQPIIENAIWHGLMPLEDRDGFLLLKAEKRGDSVIITIEDNGIGRKKSAEIKAGKPNHKTSKGIFMTQNRINLFNQKHAEKIKMVTTDLLDNNNAPIGTKVEIIIENI